MTAKRVLLAELKQETATFNPVPTSYDDFQVVSGADVLTTFRGTKTEAAGALDVFEAEDDIEVVPTMSAWAVSGGPIRDSDLDRLIDGILQRARENSDVDGAYFVLHGAMAGETERDPEGRVLAGLREILPDKPIVASLDLHAILTDRMVDAADLLVPYHTYPHSDHYETGERAARNLTRLLEGTVSPTVARVRIPMLVRGDELLTATGKFGEAIEFCQDVESTPSGLAAGVIIGNPFTDVPDLCSNVIVAT
ncbi:MAG: M81 family metallopeptidase, partial [Planctomycetes bacterium]|nr:M81 family metallopeptidase [Planctomycetota bacterium]